MFAAPTEQRNIAMLSAEIIKQTGVLDGVAAILAQQAEPYRRAHEVERPDVPLAARIIKAVNAYDDLVGDSYEPSAVSTRSSGCGSAWPTSTTRRWSTPCPRRWSARLVSASDGAGAPAVTSSSPTPAATSTSPALTTCGQHGQRHRYDVAEHGQVGVRTGRLAHRVAGEVQVGAGDPGPLQLRPPRPASRR